MNQKDLNALASALKKERPYFDATQIVSGADKAIVSVWEMTVLSVTDAIKRVKDGFHPREFLDACGYEAKQVGRGMYE